MTLCSLLFVESNTKWKALKCKTLGAYVIRANFSLYWRAGASQPITRQNSKTAIRGLFIELNNEQRSVDELGVTVEVTGANYSLSGSEPTSSYDRSDFSVIIGKSLSSRLLGSGHLDW